MGGESALHLSLPLSPSGKEQGGGLSPRAPREDNKEESPKRKTAKELFWKLESILNLLAWRSSVVRRWCAVSVPHYFAPS